MRPTLAVLILCLVALLTTGCSLRKPPALPADPCSESLPTTNSLSQALQNASQVLQDCPDRQQEVFEHLIAVGKKNPGVANRTEVLDLFERLMKFEVVNARETKEMLTRYLYVRFASIDRVNDRFSSLSTRSLERLSRDIEQELALKKVGLQEFSGSREQYERARDYARRMQDILESLQIQWSSMRAEQNS